MEKMLIHGGKKLSGEVVIGGAKNNTVALIPAAILSRTRSHLIQFHIFRMSII